MQSTGSEYERCGSRRFDNKPMTTSSVTGFNVDASEPTLDDGDDADEDDGDQWDTIKVENIKKNVP